MLADIGLLVLIPLIFVGLMLWATLTSGNPVVGLIIGWLAAGGWLGIGTYEAIKRYAP